MSGIKRSHSATTANDARTDAKKSKLDNYFSVSLPKKPALLGLSDPLVDKDSTFIAYAAQCENTHQASKLREYILQIALPDLRDDPASHVMQGTRMLASKPGKEDDFETKTTAIDDGETRGGRTIVEALANANSIDVSVCVARWFGGSMLGPKRFEDISKVAVQALYRLRDEEELAEVRKELDDKDNEIQKLLVALYRKEGKPPPPAAPIHDYDTIDLAKAKRLSTARVLRISNLKGAIAKVTSPADDELPELASKSQ